MVCMSVFRADTRDTSSKENVFLHAFSVLEKKEGTFEGDWSFGKRFNEVYCT